MLDVLMDVWKRMTSMVPVLIATLAAGCIMFGYQARATDLSGA